MNHDPIPLMIPQETGLEKGLDILSERYSLQAVEDTVMHPDVQHVINDVRVSAFFRSYDNYMTDIDADLTGNAMKLNPAAKISSILMNHQLFSPDAPESRQEFEEGFESHNHIALVSTIHQFQKCWTTIVEKVRASGQQELTVEAISRAAKSYTVETMNTLKYDEQSGEDFDIHEALFQLHAGTYLAGKKALYHRAHDTIQVLSKQALSKLKDVNDFKEAQSIISAVIDNGYATPDDKHAIEKIIQRWPAALRVNAYFEYGEYFRDAATHASTLQDASVTFSMNVVEVSSLFTGDETQRILDAVSLRLDTMQKDTESDQLDRIKPTMELDWEVLPPGQLGEVARKIVDDASKRTSAPKTIDLNRLNILEQVRLGWGKDRSYYSRGVRKGRPVVKGSDGETEPDDYMVLILQQLDDATGQVVYEHAVAESPIVGPNALYVYRQDSTEHSLGWRVVMAMSKSDSMDYGARKVKHVKAKASEDLNDVIVSKVNHLISSDPEDFPAVTFKGIDKTGNVIAWVNRAKKIGSKSIAIARMMD